MKNILIIDEVKKNTESISTILKGCGYFVSTSDSIIRAATLLSQAKYDLILCSQRTLLAKESILKSIIYDDTQHWKVILLLNQGETPSQSLMHTRTIGAITTPVDQHKLLQVIANQVKKSGITGLINDIELVDYIQVLALNKATKAFAIETEDGKGVLVIHQGKPIFAVYEKLRGEAAFQAILSLPKGKLVDKIIKKLPPPNINKPLTQLILEYSTRRDEVLHGDHATVEDHEIFLEELIPEAVPPSTSRARMPAQPRRSALRFGVAALVSLVLLAGAGWKLLAPPRHAGEAGSATPVVMKADAAKMVPLAAATALAAPTAKAPAGSTSSDIQLNQIQTAASLAPPLDIILRLHGSNTIGSELAPNLATSYLKNILQASNIRIMQKEAPVEKIVVGDTAAGTVGIEIHAHGSSTSFKDLLQGACDVGMASRKIKDKEVAEMRTLGDMAGPASEHILGLDGIAVIVNKGNPLRTLTIEQTSAIFSGKVTDWAQVSDGRMQGPITIYSRDDNSGTYDTFKGIILHDASLAAGAQRYESSPELADNVAKDRQAIGFIGLPYIRQAKALTISDQGTMPIFPNFFTVATEDYPLARRLYLYTPQQGAKPQVRNFVDFALGATGQQVVNETGFIDLAIRTFVAGFDTQELEVQDKGVFQRYVVTIQDKKRLSLNFRFRTNSTELDNRALRDLDRIVDFLRTQPVEHILLVGFADNQGDYHYNTTLALDRGKTVRDELRSRGIPISEMLSASEEMPVASNQSSRGREMNRRVEVWVRLKQA